MIKFKIIAVTPYEQNCSLVWCDQTMQASLIDPGGDIALLLSIVKQQQLNLKQIWLTHGHLDHIGGTEEISRTLKLQILGPHEDDLFLLKALQDQCTLFNFPMVKTFVPNKWLKQGDSLLLGEEKFDIIHTPGHTPGHIVIVHHPSKTVWVGDVLFKNSIGRTDFPKGNHKDLIHSIKEKLFSLPGDYQFVPGHGMGGSLQEEKTHNPFLT